MLGVTSETPTDCWSVGPSVSRRPAVRAPPVQLRALLLRLQIHLTVVMCALTSAHWAAVTEHLHTGGSVIRSLFLVVLAAAKSRAKHQHVQCLGRTSFPVHRQCRGLPTVSSLVGAFAVSFIRALIPLSGPRHLPKPGLQMPSSGVRCPRVNLGGGHIQSITVSTFQTSTKRLFSFGSRLKACEILVP